jgi:hypothetical protein
MRELGRARELQAAGRLVDGLTRLLAEPLHCGICKAEGRKTQALVWGRTRSGHIDVPMCAEHYAREGVGLGPEQGLVLIDAGPPAPIEVPEGAEPAGYAKAILDYRLTVTPPHRLTFIAARGGKRTLDRNGRVVVVLPPGYRQGPGLVTHLTFALKHEGVNLEVLSALFQRVDLLPFERELAELVTAHPTGRYVRQLWFLYEYLTNRRLHASDLRTGNYVALLDEAAYYTAPPRRSPRHRVLDNLLGTRAFCPMVRRTDRLRELEGKRLREEAANIVAEFDEDAIKRAVSYLYTKETRSSFRIEGESPSSSRTERFVGLLETIPAIDRLTREQLVRLQGEAVDPRFAEGDYRKSQVYVGEQVDLVRQKIHFIAPRPKDVPAIMDGLLECQRRIEGTAMDPVVQAAVVAFGFVFVHPFEDGNGRIHRLLVHYVLSRNGFTPKGVIFPVSAVMLQRRNEYDEALERFSVPLMRLIDYDERDDGVVTVKNETAHLYRYFDATPMAEALYAWVEQTVRNELRRELELIVAFRELRQEIGSIVDLPDRQANLFVKLCLQNSGRLSPAKRERLFPSLTGDEVTALERVVQTHLDRFGQAPREPEGEATPHRFRRTGPRHDGS